MNGYLVQGQRHICYKVHISHGSRLAKEYYIVLPTMHLPYTCT